MGKYLDRLDYRSMVEDDDIEVVTPGKGKLADAVIEDYVKGVPILEIKSKYDISLGQITSHVVARNIPRRYTNRKALHNKLSKFSDEDIRNMLDDYQAGVVPVTKIFSEYGIHKNGLYTLLDLNNIPRRGVRKKVD